MYRFIREFWKFFRWDINENFMVVFFSGYYNEKNGEFLFEILNYVIKCEFFEKIRLVIKIN